MVIDKVKIIKQTQWHYRKSGGWVPEISRKKETVTYLHITATGTVDQIFSLWQTFEMFITFGTGVLVLLMDLSNIWQH